MCYTVYTMETKTIGVRRLRQNLSEYLHRVQSGESFQVSHRGNPIAMLTPLPDVHGPIGRLVAEGRLRPARRDLTELGPPKPHPTRMSISKALEEERRER